MRVAFHGYDGKGDRIAAALEAAGHELLAADGDVALVDFDSRDLCHHHDRVVVYPHGGNPMLAWDGLFPVHPNVVLQLTHSKGHAAVLEAYGYPARCESVGWCYSDVAEPCYPDRPTRILFAPTHATGHGYIAPALHALNLRVLDWLGGMDATVRVFGSLAAHGLPDADVKLSAGGSLAHDDIDAADVVIADGTLAFLAAARGAPLIMFGSDIAEIVTFDQDGRERVDRPAHWDDYQHLLRYPYDFDDADLDELIAAVCSPNEAVTRWRDRFIEPFDPARVVALIEEVAQS